MPSDIPTDPFASGLEFVQTIWFLVFLIRWLFKHRKRLLLVSMVASKTFRKGDIF